MVKGAWYRGLYNWAKYIVGGSGENTLVIQSMTLPNELVRLPESYYGRWHLRNIDNPLDNADTGSFSRYTHVVYLKNMQTVEIRPPEPSHSLFQITIDARFYDGARRYIISHPHEFFGPLSTEKDVTVLPRKLIKYRGYYKIKFYKNTKSTISFKYYEDERSPIDTIDICRCFNLNGLISLLPSGTVTLINAMNVVSFPSCKTITGSDKENLLIAVGGETTIDAKDGDDTLVSTCGRHELIGGPGADTYVLHGPNVVDYLTISVIKGDDGSTISCKTTIYGEWIKA